MQHCSRTESSTVTVRMPAHSQPFCSVQRCCSSHRSTAASQRSPSIIKDSNSAAHSTKSHQQHRFKNINASQQQLQPFPNGYPQPTYQQNPPTDKMCNLDLETKTCPVCKRVELSS